MTEILHDHAIDTVIHFAGLKAVGESVQNRWNITTTMSTVLSA